MSHPLAIFDDAIVLSNLSRGDLVPTRDLVLYSDCDVILLHDIALSKVGEADCNIVARIKNQNFSHQGATLSNLSALDKVEREQLPETASNILLSRYLAGSALNCSIAKRAQQLLENQAAKSLVRWNFTE
jgi:lipopolysaccharide biosynthesis glycosyltransferase